MGDISSVTKEVGGPEEIVELDLWGDWKQLSVGHLYIVWRVSSIVTEISDR
jgi:hypothetical protein